MKAYITFAAVLVLFLSIGFNASANTENDPALIAKSTATCVMSGVITDAETGETLAGVALRINELNIITYSDLDGNFDISNLPAGKYTLTAELISYKSTLIVQNVIPAQSNESIKIKLDR